MRARAVVAAAVLALASVVGVGGLFGVAAAQTGTGIEGGGFEEPSTEGSEPGVEGTQAEEEADISHAAEECIHLLEGGGEPDECAESPSPILPATNELVWGILSFAILLILLKKFAFPGVMKAMAGRTERIRANLDDAERVKTEAAGVLSQYQAQLTDARNESNRIIEEARATAEGLRRDLMARAETEVAELRQRTRDDIASAQDRATADLSAKVGALAIELAEKVVAANLDRDTNMRLIEQFIAEADRQKA